jgi:two-component system, OmpR family, response regulator
MAVTPAKILVVEDDSAIRNLISRFLGQKNYQVQGAADGKTALELFHPFNPDLVILDVNLPDTLGYYLCEQMRQETDVFILMLTSRLDVQDKRQGFLKGADDYLTKPFDIEELEWRIAAILKRRRAISSQEHQYLKYKHLSINPVGREVLLSGQVIALTSLEFDILYCLASHPNRVWSRSDLIHEVWGYDYIGDNRVVDVHVGQIRKKIESDTANPDFIQTVRGIGYKFIAQSSPSLSLHGS